MDNLPQNQYPPAPAPVAKSNFLQSSGGKLILGGVIILLLLLGLLLLNYFTATNPFLLHKSVIQKSDIVQPNTTISSDFSSNPLFKKAQSLGYEIIWMNPQDSVGRTVFYNAREKSDYDFRGSGIVYAQFGTDSNKVASYVVGTFEGFEEIKDSSDEYIKFTDPITGISLPRGRVIFTKDNSKQTNSLVENLSYGPNNPYVFKEGSNENNLGLLSNWSKEDLKKVIKPGDALVLNILSKSKDGIYTNEKDQNKEFIGTVLIMRRFGGKEQINQELRGF